MKGFKICLVYEDKTISADKYICDERWLESLAHLAEYLLSFYLEFNNNPSKKLITMNIFSGTKPKDI